MKVRIILLLLLGCFAGLGSLAADNFTKGRDAFMYNRPQEAVTLLEKAIGESPANADAWIYLAIAYEQLGKYDKAESTLQTAWERGVGEAHLILYNMGNVLSRIASTERAINAYTQSLEARPEYAPSALNRGNQYIRSGKLQEAKADYLRFLELVPEHPKAADVRKMIAAIDGEFTAREEQRLAEERRKAEEERRRLAKEEADRIAAEQARIEEERRKALLEKIFSGLDDAKGDAFGVDGGTEGIDDKEDDFGRED